VQIDDQSSALGLGRPDAHDCTLAGYGIFVDLAAFYGLCWSSVYGANRNWKSACRRFDSAPSHHARPARQV